MAEDTIKINILADVKSAVEGFGKTALGMVGLYEAVKKGIEFLKSSVTEYLKAEESLTILGSALRSTGEYSEYAVAQLSGYATALQGTTKYSHEASEGALSMLMSIGGLTSKMAQDALPAVQDFASAMGMDLESASRLVSKAFEGNVAALGRYGIKVEAGLDSTQRFTAVTKALEDRFGGLAQAVGETASGKLAQLENAFADVKEEIGRATVSAIKPFVAYLSEVTRGLSDAFKASNDLREALAAQEKGQATLNDKLTIEQTAYQHVLDVLKMLEAPNATHQRAIMLQAEMQKYGAKTLDQLRDAMQNSLPVFKAHADAAQKQLDVERKAADARAAAAKAAQEQADTVDTAYKKTDAGAKDSINDQITLFEKMKGATKDQAEEIKGILEDLYGQRDAIWTKEAKAQDDEIARIRAVMLAGKEAREDQLLSVNSTGELTTAIEEVNVAAYQNMVLMRGEKTAFMDYADVAMSAAKDTEKAWTVTWQNVADVTTAALDMITSLSQDYYQNLIDGLEQQLSDQLAAIDEQKNAELDAFDKKRKNSEEATQDAIDQADIEKEYRKKITGGMTKEEADAWKAEQQQELTDKIAAREVKEAQDEEYEKARAAIEQKYADQKAAAEKAIKKQEYQDQLAMWNWQQGAKLAQAIIDTASAVIEAAPNPIAMIAAGVAGALAVATIAAQSPPAAPSFQGGGEFTVPPGFEGDSFPMRVSSGERVSVTPAGEGGDIHLVVNLDGSVLIDTVQRAVRNRKLIIEGRDVR